MGREDELPGGSGGVTGPGHGRGSRESTLSPPMRVASHCVGCLTDNVIALAGGIG
jgi:hypothetical protein